MEIRLSRYNLPFTEPSTHEVHYISLDDQRAIRAGQFDAHVHQYLSTISRPVFFTTRTFRTNDVFEVFDPLTGSTRVHDLSGASFFPALLNLLLLLILKLLSSFVSAAFVLHPTLPAAPAAIANVRGGVYVTSRDDRLVNALARCKFA
jgi:hypothetical protein